MLSLELQKALEAINVDIPTALERLNNNEGLYVKLLGLFSKSSVDAPAQYREFIANDDANALLHLVHDLKSSSGNLGLTDLYEAAVAFELATKTSHVIDKVAAEALVVKLETVLKVLLAV